MSSKLHRETASSRSLVQSLENRLLMAASGGDSSAYTAIELKPVGTSVTATTWAYAINNTGLAVGESGNHGASAWQVNAAGTAATPIALPELFQGWSEAYDVNDVGQLVGTSATAEVFPEDGLRVHHAVIWQANGAGAFTVTDLGTPAGFAQSAALDVNDDGQVLGVATNYRHFPDENSGGTYFLWDSTGVHDINTLPRNQPGWTLRSANDINDNGQIVGEGLLNGEPRGFRLNLSTSEIVALPGLTNQTSYPATLNNVGHVVGNAYVRTVNDSYWGPTEIHNAFVWSGSGTATNLGTLGDRSSHARGINQAGTVVGWSNSTKKGSIIDLFGINTATIWSNNTMKDINTLKPAKTPWQMTRAFDISDGGTIVTEAYGTSRTNNYTHAVLLRPKVAATASATLTASSTGGSNSLFASEPAAAPADSDRLIEILA
jgi:probable HAF family extracellular repeat protein